METIFLVVQAGIFSASILFLVAAGLQIVFGVQNILNLACGSFYAFGAYLGIVLVKVFIAIGFPAIMLIIPLILAGLIGSLLGPVIERGLLRFLYDRDETLQLLLTFAIVLMFEDLMRMIWGSFPRTTARVYFTYGQLTIFGANIPVYNIIVILSSIIIATAMWYILTNTQFGRVMRATADKREVSEALGVNVNLVYIKAFTLGTGLGTLGGALVIPTTAAQPGMAVHLIVLAFAVVVIGGLGSVKGAAVGALIVGLLQAISIATFPKLEMSLIYLIVIAILAIKPRGLFGKELRKS